jgi:hypothetical protein
MHPRPLACVFLPLAVWFSVTSLSAQSPTAPVPDRAPPVPLITEPPVSTKNIPARIPTADTDSITATENAVLAIHDATIAAAEACDLEQLFSHLVPTNRGAMISNGRITLTQDDVMATTRRDFAGLTSVRYTYAQRHVTVLSPTSAIIAGDGSVTATTRDGTGFTRPFAQTIVFMRIDETWKVIHMHSSAPLEALGP